MQTYTSNRIRAGGALGKLLRQNKELNPRAVYTDGIRPGSSGRRFISQSSWKCTKSELNLGAEISERIAAETTIFSEPDIGNTIDNIQANILTDTSAVFLLHVGQQYIKYAHYEGYCFIW